jgi:hypothetical protein
MATRLPLECVCHIVIFIPTKSTRDVAWLLEWRCISKNFGTYIPTCIKKLSSHVFNKIDEEGIKIFTGIEYIDCTRYYKIKDWEMVIRSMKYLVYLNCGRNVNARLGGMSQLQTLVAWNITDEEAIGLTNLTSLTLSLNEDLTTDGLSKLSNLTFLDIMNCGSIQYDGASLYNLTKLVSLSVSQETPLYLPLSLTRNLTSLVSFKEGWALTNDPSDFPNLKNLVLSRDNTYENELSKFSSITALGLHNLPEKEMSVLLDVPPNLKKLSISGRRGTIPPLSLSLYTSIETLELTRITFGKNQLSGFINLTRLVFDQVYIHNLEFLTGLTTLTELIICDNVSFPSSELWSKKQLPLLTQLKSLSYEEDNLTSGVLSKLTNLTSLTCCYRFYDVPECFDENILIELPLRKLRLSTTHPISRDVELVLWKRGVDFKIEVETSDFDFF